MILSPGGGVIGSLLIANEYFQCVQIDLPTCLNMIGCASSGIDITMAATIKCMPLLNILGLCGNTPPITIAIIVYTNHMQEWDIYCESFEERVVGQ